MKAADVKTKISLVGGREACDGSWMNGSVRLPKAWIKLVALPGSGRAPIVEPQTQLLRKMNTMLVPSESPNLFLASGRPGKGGTGTGLSGIPRFRPSPSESLFPTA